MGNVYIKLVSFKFLTKNLDDIKAIKDFEYPYTITMNIFYVSYSGLFEVQADTLVTLPFLSEHREHFAVENIFYDFIKQNITPMVGVYIDGKLVL